MKLTTEQATEAAWMLVLAPLGQALNAWHQHETTALTALSDTQIRHALAGWLAPMDTTTWHYELPMVDHTQPVTLTPTQEADLAAMLRTVVLPADWRDSLDAYTRGVLELHTLTDTHAQTLVDGWLAAVPTTRSPR